MNINILYSSSYLGLLPMRAPISGKLLAKNTIPKKRNKIRYNFPASVLGE